MGVFCAYLFRRKSQSKNRKEDDYVDAENWIRAD